MITKVSSPSLYEPPAASSAEEDLHALLSRVIESTKSDPAQLRILVYELARANLQRQGWRRNPPVGIMEMRRYLHALEAAIVRIESIAAEEDDLRAILSRYHSMVSSRAEPAQAAMLVPYRPIEARTLPLAASPSRRPPAWRVASRFGSTGAPMLKIALVAVLAIGLYEIVGGLRGSDRSSDGPPNRVAVQTPEVSEIKEPPRPPEPIVRLGTQSVLLPKVYGVYAASDGQLSDLEALSINIPDQKVFMSTPITKASRTTTSDGKIAFIAFRRDLMTNAPERVTIRIVAKVMREMKFNSGGKPVVTNLDDLWAVRNSSYEFRVAPLSEHPEMIVMQSENESFAFPAGRYALVLKGQAYDFSVAGPITEPAQCLERIQAVNGAVYSECRNP